MKTVLKIVVFDGLWSCLIIFPIKKHGNCPTYLRMSSSFAEDTKHFTEDSDSNTGSKMPISEGSSCSTSQTAQKYQKCFWNSGAWVLLLITLRTWKIWKWYKMISQVPQPSHKLMAVKFPRQVYITEQFHSSSDSSLICAWTVTTPFGPAVKSWREETKRGWWGWHDCPVELSKLYETGWLKTTLVLIWKKDQEQLTMLSRCLRLPAFPTSSQPGQMVLSKQMGIQLVYREVSFLEEVLILQTMGFCGHPFLGRSHGMTGWLDDPSLGRPGKGPCRCWVLLVQPRQPGPDVWDMDGLGSKCWCYVSYVSYVSYVKQKCQRLCLAGRPWFWKTHRCNSCYCWTQTSLRDSATASYQAFRVLPRLLTQARWHMFASCLGKGWHYLADGNIWSEQTTLRSQKVCLPKC